MKQYAVTIPVAGSIIVYVDAESEEQALELAHEKQDWSVNGSDSTEIGEFEALNHICQGNVCYAPCWDISVEEQ